MRLDENGDQCPETLGEYYDYMKAIFGDQNEATKFLQQKIDNSPNKREEKVLASDIEMRFLLFRMANQSIKFKESELTTDKKGGSI